MSVSSRVLFREAQLLRAADLQGQQQYLLGMAGRHNFAPHKWGIVRGLFVTLQGDVVTIHPGRAIDGYGRELSVFQPVRVTLSHQPATLYLYLYYCERLQGACGQAPNSRFRDSAEVHVESAAWPIPASGPDLSSATAAGSIPGATPWPVLLAFVRVRAGNLFRVHTSHDLYTRLRASSIRSSTGGTLVRIGQENLADPYPFRVSLKTAANILQRRFALDRDGNSIFWGDLILTSKERGALFPTQIDGFDLMAQVKSTAGGPVRAQSTFQPGKPSSLTISFRVNSTPSSAGVNDVLVIETPSTPKKVKEAIRLFNKSSKSVHISELLNPPKVFPSIRSRSIAPPPPLPTPVFDDRELSLGFTGADLSFTPEDVPTPLPCDCLTPIDNPELLPEGFIFLPGTDPPAPPARDIYRIKLQPKDQPPSDELRITGGAKKDGDFSRHLCISGQNANGFIPLLTFRGNGSLALPGDLSLDAVAYHLIQVVGGTTQLPIVKPDPRDPLFNYLLVLAFIQGVMSSSTQLIKVDFPNFPTFFETAEDVNYTFTLQNLSTTGPLTPDKCSETLLISGLAVFGSVPLTSNLLPFAAPTPVTITHPGSQIPAGSTSLQVEIDVSMKLSSLTVGGKKLSPTVPVLESPSPDLSGLANPIVSNTAFDISISNASNVDLVLTSAQLTGPGPAQVLLTGTMSLAAGQTKNLPVKGSANVAATSAAKFTLSITYYWMFSGTPSSPRTLTIDKTVKVT